MELKIIRKYKKSGYTIGCLMVDGQYVCDTLEPQDRGLHIGMNAKDVRKVKQQGWTAIPTGRYRLTLDVKSPRFSQRIAYQFCKGYVPRFMGIPGYSGVLIHIGNFPEDTQGCVLVGKNVERGKVLYSTLTFHRLYKMMEEAHGKGEELWCTMERNFKTPQS